jgi:hypothetical protein
VEYSHGESSKAGLLFALQRKTTYITSTGGFRYEAKIYNGDAEGTDGYLWLRMAFEIERWDNAE